MKLFGRKNEKSNDKDKAKIKMVEVSALRFDRDFKNVFQQEAAAMQEQLVAWRRDLHRIPETGIKLPGTMKYIQEKLEEMGIACELHEDISCITATIGSGGKCFLRRRREWQGNGRNEIRQSHITPSPSRRS